VKTSKPRRVAIVSGVVIELLVVSALLFCVLGVIPPVAFGGVPIPWVAFALHLPASLLSLPILSVTNALGLGLIPSLVATAVIVGSLQVVFLGAVTLVVLSYPKISAASAALLLVAAIAVHHEPPPYPDGMDSNRDGLASMDEWLRFHATHPKFYGGYDHSGYIVRGSADYYELEFKRVDCNEDLQMDAYEYGELHWNLRWCGSPQRPPRPWWK
jgi:hypothetical protein